MKCLLITLVCASLGYLPCAQAQQWQSIQSHDDRTDEEVWIASIHIVVKHTDYKFFINCRTGKNVSVGLIAPDVDPRAEDYGYRDFYPMQVRFGDGEAKKTYFVRQGGVMFINPSPLLIELAELDEEGILPIWTRQQQIFIKNITEHEQLRISFPHVQGTLLLDFPSAGSKLALLTVAEHCRVPAATGPKFIDAEGTPYRTLADFLRDDTWLDRQ